MAKTTVVWDYAAAGELLLKSDEIAAVCEEEAERMTRATGVEYASDVFIGKTRVRAGAYDNAEGDTSDVCPRCGEWHPNCRCGSSKK